MAASVKCTRLVIGVALLSVLFGLVVPCPNQCDCSATVNNQTGEEELTVDCGNRSLTRIPNLNSLTGQVGAVLLNDNQITHLMRASFGGLHARKLDLSNNPINSISDLAFEQTEFLEALVMTNCGISSTSKAFGALTQLKRLDLRDNDISTFATNSIKKMTRLEEIYLQNNPLQLPPATFDDMHRVRILDMSNCHIVSLPDTFGQFVNLTYMNASSNNIQTVSASLTRTLTKLRTLDLADNPINLEEEHDIFAHLSQLEVLRLNGCSRRHVTKAFLEGLSNVRELRLSHCKVHILDSGVFSRMKKLQVLDLSGNHMILKMADFTGITDTITTLKMGNGNYTKYPTTIFQPFKNLRHIFMNENELLSLHSASFAGMAQGDVHIHLENNRISEISPLALEGARRPVTLYLAENPLPNVDFLNAAPCKFQLATIDVTGLDVDCCCELLTAVQQKSFTLIGRCSSPPERAGLHLDWRPGVLPEGQYLEPNATDACGVTDRRNKRYECTCSSWLPHDSDHRCGLVGGGTAALAHVTVVFPLLWLNVLI